MENELFSNVNIPNDVKDIMDQHEFELYVKFKLLSSLDNIIMDSMKVDYSYDPQYDMTKYRTSFVIMDRLRYKQLLKIESEYHRLLSYPDKPVIEQNPDEKGMI